MKLASDVTEVLDIDLHHTHVITFEDTQLCETFIQSFLSYLQKKPQKDEHYAHFITDGYETINVQKFHPIILNCGDRNILGQKVIEDQVLNHFENQIIYDEKTNKIFNEFEESLNIFKQSLGIYDDYYHVEIHDNVIKLKKLLKLLGYEFHYDLRDLDETRKRKAFIDLMRKKEKEEILVVLYPESYLGIKEIEDFLTMIKMYQLTTLVFTNHPSVIMSGDHAFLCKSNKTCHDLNLIKEELKLFMPEEMITSKMVHLIAYHEFIGDNLLELGQYFKFINQYE